MKTLRNVMIRTRLKETDVQMFVESRIIIHVNKSMGKVFVTNVGMAFGLQPRLVMMGTKYQMMDAQMFVI